MAPCGATSFVVPTKRASRTNFHCKDAVYKTTNMQAIQGKSACLNPDRALTMVSARNVEFRFSLFVLRVREDVLSVSELEIFRDASALAPARA